MIETTKYVRKPLYVEAVHVTDENFDAIAEWCQGEIKPRSQTIDKPYIKVRVHSPKSLRQTQAFAGDWILYTDRGYKVYTDHAFNNSFDLVGEDNDNPDQLNMEEIKEAVV